MTSKNSLHPKVRALFFLSLLCALLFTSCNTVKPAAPATPTPKLASELVFYDWYGDVPDNVLDAFYNEFGVQVRYLTYESQEEALENMRQGNIYDVVVMDDSFIPTLTGEKLLTEIDHQKVPNIKNIAKEFMGRRFDPENRYVIPFNWGLTGLVVNYKTAAAAINEWKDLWKLEADQKVLIWKMQRETIGMTLRSLGYSANSENPQELQEALTRLLELKKHIIFIEDVSEDDSTSIQAMQQNFGIAAVSFSYDIQYAEEQGLNYIEFIFPGEGALAWGDNFVIPANSSNKETAETFLNFLLRPEISAALTINNSYPTPNQAAQKYLPEEMLSNPIIFPEAGDLQRVETILPLSPEGEKLYEDIWTQFLEAEVP